MRISNLGIVSYQFKEIFKFLNFVVGDGVFRLIYVYQQIINGLPGMIIECCYPCCQINETGWLFRFIISFDFFFFLLEGEFNLFIISDL